jgi:DNA-binding NtrC family response regulator
MAVTTWGLESGGAAVNILPVNSSVKDWNHLQRIVQNRHRNHTPGLGWMLLARATWPAALKTLRESAIPVVVCETERTKSRNANWREVLAQLQDLPHPPSLIVTSRLADERLWAEALNLGAYDVLAEPFNEDEVVRTITAAWQHWRNRLQPAVRSFSSAVA